MNLQKVSIALTHCRFLVSVFPPLKWFQLHRDGCWYKTSRFWRKQSRNIYYPVCQTNFVKPKWPSTTTLSNILSGSRLFLWTLRLYSWLPRNIWCITVKVKNLRKLSDWILKYSESRKSLLLRMMPVFGEAHIHTLHIPFLPLSFPTKYFI